MSNLSTSSSGETKQDDTQLHFLGSVLIHPAATKKDLNSTDLVRWTAIFSYLHFNEYDRLSVHTYFVSFVSYCFVRTHMCRCVYDISTSKPCDKCKRTTARVHVLYHLYKLQWKTIIYYKLLWDRNFLFRFSLLLHFSEHERQRHLPLLSHTNTNCANFHIWSIHLFYVNLCFEFNSFYLR